MKKDDNYLYGLQSITGPQECLIRLEVLTAKMKTLKEKYDKVQKEFNEVCDILDSADKIDIYQKTIQLTILLDNINTLDSNIKKIDTIMKLMKFQLSN